MCNPHNNRPTARDNLLESYYERNAALLHVDEYVLAPLRDPEVVIIFLFYF